VKNHVQHIIAKLGVSDRTQAVVRAVEISPQNWGFMKPQDGRTIVSLYT